MGAALALQDLLSSRRGWTDDVTIYVVQPWSCDAEALPASESPDTTAPVIRSGRRYDYFLEGFIARDSETVGKEACERFIWYAIYDA